MTRQPSLQSDEFRALPADDLGRPTGTLGYVTREHLGEYVGPPLNVRSPAAGGPENGYVRAQLVSSKVGMQSTTVLNIVALRLGCFLEVCEVEARVSDAARDGEVVFYSVTPQYEQSRRIPSAIRVVARGDRGLRLDLTIRN